MCRAEVEKGKSRVSGRNPHKSGRHLGNGRNKLENTRELISSRALKPNYANSPLHHLLRRPLEFSARAEGAWLSFFLVVPFFPLVVLVLCPVLVFPSRALRRDCWSCSIAAASPNCSAALAASVSFSFVALPGVRLKTSPTLDLRFCRRRFSARRRLFLIVRDCRRFNRVPALAGTCVLCMLVCFLVSSVALKLTLFQIRVSAQTGS